MQSIKAEFYHYRYLVLFSLCWFALNYAAALSFGAPFLIFTDFVKYYSYVLMQYVALCAMALVYIALRALWRKQNAVQTVRQAVCQYVQEERYAALLPILIAMFGIFSCVSMSKSLVQYINPYQWDMYFYEMDIWLHGGVLPHEILLSLTPLNEFSTLMILKLSYMFWFFVMIIAYWYVIFIDGNRVHRDRFLWASSICWVLLGGFSALYFSSVGPVFWHDFYPDLVDPYVLLNEKVDKLWGVIGVNTSEYLLTAARDETIIDVNGISAMPSMHVSVTMFVMLYGYLKSRDLGTCLLIYTGLILSGSICLAWHYAVDGYYSMIATLLIWWLVGKLIRN